MTEGFIDKTLVAPVRLDDVHGAWEFHPEADIAPYELALIAALFTAMVVRQTRLDWREFLTRERVARLGPDGAAARCDLARHFKEV